MSTYYTINLHNNLLYNTENRETVTTRLLSNTFLHTNFLWDTIIYYVLLFAYFYFVSYYHLMNAVLPASLLNITLLLASHRNTTTRMIETYYWVGTPAKHYISLKYVPPLSFPPPTTPPWMVGASWQGYTKHQTREILFLALRVGMIFVMVNIVYYHHHIFINNHTIIDTEILELSSLHISRDPLPSSVLLLPCIRSLHTFSHSSALTTHKSNINNMLILLIRVDYIL